MSASIQIQKMVYTGMDRNDRIQPFPVPGPPEFRPSCRGFAGTVYRCVDRAANRVLARLETEDGIVPSCRPGCCACCKQHILVTVVEARALAEYIRLVFTPAGIRALKKRTRRWIDWDRRRLQRMAAEVRLQEGAASRHPACPLLTDGRCSVYPMRPITCRTHFVSSPPRYCRHDNDPKVSGGSPLSLTAVVLATDPFSAMIRDRIEAGGGDYLKSIMLLPHWLSIEMGWESASTA